MEYRTPPHTNPYSGALTTGQVSFAATGYSGNRIQQRPVIRDAIDTSIQGVTILNAGHDQNQPFNECYVSPVYEIELVQPPVPNVVEYKYVNTRFQYNRDALPEGSESYYSDIQLSIVGIKVVWVRVIEYDPATQVTSDSGYVEQSRVPFSQNLTFNEEGYPVEVDAPDLCFSYEKTETEYTMYGGWQYQTKQTITITAVWPNEDMLDDNVGTTSLYLQFDVTGLRTFFD